MTAQWPDPWPEIPASMLEGAEERLAAPTSIDTPERLAARIAALQTRIAETDHQDAAHDSAEHEQTDAAADVAEL